MTSKEGVTQGDSDDTTVTKQPWHAGQGRPSTEPRRQKPSPHGPAKRTMVVKPTVLPASAQPHKPTWSQCTGRKGKLDGDHDRDGFPRGEPGPTPRMPGLEAPTGSVRGPDGQQEAELQGTDQMAPTATRGIRAYGARRLSSDPNTQLTGRPAPTRGPSGQREGERPRRAAGGRAPRCRPDGLNGRP